MRLSRPWLALVIALFCLPLFVGLGRADIENDEAIYSFGVDRLLEIGDWLAPRSSPHEDAVFLEKPPLKFWIVAAPMQLGLMPHDEFGMRFWDASFGAIAFAYIFAIGHLLAGPVCGAVAVLVLFVHGPLVFEHGLRTNNMEAALFLSYCAGVFHFLRWARVDSVAARRWHAVAVGLAFVLGFMTKFVAAIFLPMTLVVAALPFADVRKRLFGDWRLWTQVTALVVLLCAPWFLYAQARFGSALWTTILQEHVYTRFTAFLDPAHVHSWHYYVLQMYDHLRDADSLELSLIGLAALLVQAARLRWFEGTLVIGWLVLPIFLISTGTSKLYHYAYPFLPPVALAAGYAAALALTLAPLVFNAGLRWMDRTRARWPRALGLIERPSVRRLLLAIMTLALAVGVVTVLYGPIRLEYDGTVFFRSSGVFRPGLTAALVGLLAGLRHRGLSWTLGVVVVGSLLPLAAYRPTLARLTLDEHPMSTASSCLQSLRASMSDRGWPGLYVDLPQDVLTHGMYYYFRRVQPWTRAQVESPEALESFLTDVSNARPMLVYDSTYQKYMHGSGAGVRERTASPPMVSFPNVVLLLPGPYSVCAGVSGTRGLRSR